MLAQQDLFISCGFSLVCLHDCCDLVRHGRLLVSCCFSYKKAKIAISLICQEKFEFHQYFFIKFTKLISTNYAITAFSARPGIAGHKLVS